MFAKFFIDRPVFATVLSLLITLLGLVAIQNLPIAQFPEIVPPSVVISATYPGASAETVSQSVAAPIEQQLSGARHLIYYQSQSGNDGTLKITATFEIGSDQDLAAVEVQNRLAIAQPRLPQEVVRQGITVTKTSTSLLCVVALRAEAGEFDDVYLANYATINLLDAIKRVPGVGDATIFGGKDYAMRVWVDPDRLAQKAFTVTDLATAIRDQNAVFPAGRIGQRPGPADQQLTLPVLTRGRLENPEDYEDIILRANPDGSMLRLKDLAKVELGSQTYDLFGRLDGKATTLILIYLQTGANALSTYDAVEKSMKEAQRSFPKGVEWLIPYDTVQFIRASMESVVRTLIEAGILVILVVFIFLQNWRATIIPLVAVPVAIIGTFAGMMALGFTINSLTLFGMVLAIGIVVDDAIVVVENVERIMHEEHLPVREATIKAMDQVTGPVVAIVLVLAAVFLPVAFLGGLTGELYRQFAVTIAVSVAISGLVALTLSPAMCRLLLKPESGKRKFILFRWFNTVFDGLTHAYSNTVKLAIRLALVTMLIFGGLLFVTFRLFQTVPGGFIPDEDQGYIIVAMILPDGASIDRTDKLASEVETFLKSDPNVIHTVMLGGFDFLAGGINSTNTGILFARLKPWAERTAPDQSAKALIGKVYGHFATNRAGLVLPFNPPAIQGLGQRAGFEFQLQARGAGDVRDLAAVNQTFMAAAAKRPEITGLNATLRVNTPQLFVDLDRDKAKMLGLSLTDIFNSLQAYLGALYINDFDKFGRIWRVQVQAEPQFRKSPESITNIYVRNETGGMVPLSEVVTLKLQSGPNTVARFNGFPAVQITGAPGAGFSTGDSMQAMRDVAAEVLPPGYGYEWSGASFQEIKAGNQAPIVVGFGLIVVFLVLAAQYEKWSLPFAVLLAVPIGVFGALVAVWWRNFPNDIYFQIGLLTLVGLAAKNAILIVEFCAMERASGKGLVESAVNAARLRFRPIVMTSLAFILGVVPLAIARGAGAAGRQSIGTGVLGGMIAATFLAIFFVPVFFVLIQALSEKLFEKHGRHAGGIAPESKPAPTTAAH
ncbi:MAG: multidrug efflux RND transporter permease subunit [Phycisphaerales bacterium]